MLGIGCPDRHALLRITSPKLRRPRRLLPSRERVRSSTQSRLPVKLGRSSAVCQHRCWHLFAVEAVYSALDSFREPTYAIVISRHHFRAVVLTAFVPGTGQRARGASDMYSRRISVPLALAGVVGRWVTLPITLSFRPGMVQ